MELTIHHFYPNLLNTYGDIGNILALKHRCEKRNISLNINNIQPNDNPTLNKGDIIFIGGGQDFEQSIVSKDLINKQTLLKDFIEDNGVALLICGGYQLLGKSYVDPNGNTLEGLCILDTYTISSNKRNIGNIIIKNDMYEETYVGFENHSGKTYINNHTPLGKCLLGFGNNGEDGTEGVIYKNLIGTYIHGPLLPKNPELTDRLIFNALKEKYNLEKLDELDSELEIQCKNFILNRFLSQKNN